MTDKLVDQTTLALVQKVREQLLDLTGRNPLISFKHAARSNGFVRFVDELPDAVVTRLDEGVRLEIIGVPAPELEPDEEKTPAFRSLLEKTRKSAVASHQDPSAQSETTLRNAARATLGWPERADMQAPPAEDHARALGIDTSFELPRLSDASPKLDKHTDTKLQTLLYADALTKRLKKIHDKSKLWLSEKGLNALHVSIGFLEWKETDTSTASVVSPLLLYPVDVVKELVRGEYIYFLRTRGEDIAVNLSLAEKLKREFGLVLPSWTEVETPEAYFEKVAEVVSRRRGWSVRRFLTLGFFHFSKVSIYADLDPERWPQFADDSSVAKRLLEPAGSGTIDFPSEYDFAATENPTAEPFLITEADASQSSAIFDVCSGKDMVLEGPPGTGKSQTITSIIGAALHSGKSVLFIAEKRAALEVVKARLDRLGIGEFCLELHSSNSSKTEVLESLAKTIDLRRESVKFDSARDVVLDRLESRTQEIGHYVGKMNSSIGKLSITVHKALWRVLQLRSTLQLSAQISSVKMARASDWDDAAFAKGKDAVRHYARRHADTLGDATSCSSWAKLIPVPKLEVSEERLTQAVENLDSILLNLQGLVKERGTQELASRANLKFLRHISQACSDLPITSSASEDLFRAVKSLPTVEAAQKASTHCDQVKSLLKEASSIFRQPPVYNQIHDLEPLAEGLKAAVDQDTALEVLPSLLAELKSLRIACEKSAALVDSIVSICGSDRPSSKETLTMYLNTISVVRNTDLPTLEIQVDGLNSRSEIDSCGAMLASLGDAIRTRNGLLEKWTFESGISASVLSAAISTVEQGSVWTWLSNRHRAAKRTVIQSCKIVGAKLTDVLTVARLAQENLRLWEQVCADKWYKSVFKDQTPEERDVVAYIAKLSWIRLVLDATPADLEGGIALRRAVLDQSMRAIARLRSQDVEAAMSGLQTIISSDDNVVDPAAAAKKLSERETILAPLIDQVERIGLLQAVTVRQVHAAASAAQKMEVELNAIEAIPDIGPWFRALPNDQKIAANLTGSAAIAGVLKTLMPIGICPADTADLYLTYQSGISWVRTELTPVLVKALDLIATVVRSTIDEENTSAHWLTEQPLLQLRLELAQAVSSKQGLASWLRFQRAKSGLFQMGIEWIDKVPATEVTENRLSDLLETVVLGSLLEEAQASSPILANALGTELNAARTDFRNLDKHALEQNRLELRKYLMRKFVDPGVESSKASMRSGLALLQHELTKKKRHIQLRELFQRSGKSIADLKPCFMMSPLSVSQYLPRETCFDLVVLDEASQVRVEDALGALLRGKQAVIVGDSMQLPPTDFFKASSDIESEDESEESDDLITTESILEQASKAFKVRRQLRWHYRSRHQTLIEYSNQNFYSGNLIVFPSSKSPGPGIGLTLVQANGTYQAQKNIVEAREIVALVKKHSVSDIKGSLGIVTINQAQCELVSLMLDDAAREDKDFAKYRAELDASSEPLFVKNLENVQGDERDVLIISMVYGPDEGGRQFNRFGPINGKYGHRRLNVLFTRARRCMLVLSSLDPSRIDGTSPGVVALKGFLSYARHGKLPVSNTYKGAPREPDSDFEIHVARQISALGYQCEPQVGCAGFSIDIGIRDPRNGTKFIAGIECDGASYHSAKSARDRDRNRQDILESLGWRIYRIWSTDWYSDQKREINKLAVFLQLLVEQQKQAS